MSPAAAPLVALLGDRPRRRPPRPVPPPERPEDRPPAAPPDRPQAGGAEDPVGRPVVADRLPGRLLDRRPCRARRRRAAWPGVRRSWLRWRWQWSSTRWPAATISAASDGPPHDLLAGEEEGRGGAGLAQDLEHERRPLRVRAVVEGDRDAVRPRLAQLDPERLAQARHDRCQGRAGVDDAPRRRGRRRRAGRSRGGGRRPRCAQQPAAAACDGRCGGRRVFVLAEVDPALERLRRSPGRASRGG